MLHMTLLASAATATMLGVNPYGEFLPHRDQHLVEPRPYPPNRVDSPARLENGRLWRARTPVGSRTPIAEQVYGYGHRGAAWHGAPVEANHRRIFVRVNHVPIAISPWRPFTENGFKHFREAQNIWLREHGWVGGVRTHVNARYLDDADRADSPKPRATIRLHGEPRSPRMRVERLGHDVRIRKPAIARVVGPPRVVVPPSESLAQSDENEGAGR